MRCIASLFALFLASVMMPNVAAGHNCGHHNRCGSCDDCGDCRSSTDAAASSVPAGRQRLQGTVAETIYLPAATPAEAMLEVRVQNGSEAHLVRLSPGHFLRQHGLKIKEGDVIALSGFTVSAAHGDLFIALEVTKNGTTVRLRNTRGRPLW